MTMQEISFSANPKTLKFKSPFSKLFVRTPAMVEAIAASIKAEGFRLAEPVVCWDGVVIDGHTRIEAARLAGCGNVYGVSINFPDEQAAIEYAIARQRNRRNLTEAELLRCVLELDKRKTAGRPSGEKLPQDCGNSEDRHERTSASTTAATLGISPRKVEQARTVLDHAPEPVKAAVQAGEMSINAAYRETQAARRAETAPEPPAEPSPQSVLDEAAELAAKREKWIANLRAVYTAKDCKYWPTMAECMRQVASEIEAELTKETP
jgi:hypothetical protein